VLKTRTPELQLSADFYLEYSHLSITSRFQRKKSIKNGFLKEGDENGKKRMKRLMLISMVFVMLLSVVSFGQNTHEIEIKIRHDCYAFTNASDLCAFNYFINTGDIKAAREFALARTLLNKCGLFEEGEIVKLVEPYREYCGNNMLFMIRGIGESTFFFINEIDRDYRYK
jgi:hypothetical protein